MFIQSPAIRETTARELQLFWDWRGTPLSKLGHLRASITLRWSTQPPANCSLASQNEPALFSSAWAPCLVGKENDYHRGDLLLPGSPGHCWVQVFSAYRVSALPRICISSLACAPVDQLTCFPLPFPLYSLHLVRFFGTSRLQPCASPTSCRWLSPALPSL